MKKLVLLALALPLAGCMTAAEKDRLRVGQASEARGYCSARDQGPSAPGYWKCVNRYLDSRYHWQVVQLRDGSLAPAYHRYSAPMPPL